MLVGENVDFDGSLVNDGQIFGGVDLGQGDLELSDSSILSLEISSLTDFDSIIANDILFDGTLELLFDDQFDVQAGDTFDLFDFNSIGGSTDIAGVAPASLFDVVIADGVLLDISSLSSVGSVTVAAVNAVPEPSSLVLLVVAGCGYTLRRRRS